jgi:hypothetical protein
VHGIGITMDFEDDVYLYAVILSLSDELLINVKSAKELYSCVLSPSDDYDQIILNRLAKLGCMSYPTDDAKSVDIHLPSDVKSIIDYALRLDELLKNESEGAADELENLSIKVSVHESLFFVKHMLAHKGFSVSLGLKQYSLIEWGLSFFTVGQLNSLLWSSIKSVLISVDNRNDNLVESVFFKFSYLVKSALKYDWTVTEYKRMKALPQSYLSQIVFNHILRLGHDGYGYKRSEVKEE